MYDLVNKAVYNSRAIQVKKFLSEKNPKAIFIETCQFSDQNEYTHLIILHSKVSSKEISECIGSPEFDNNFFSKFEASFKLILLEFPLSDLFMGYCYYSYNIGFLLNELIKPLDLVLTDKGLFQIKDGEQKLLSNSWFKICDILDLSFKTWERGFKNPEELFMFVALSRYVINVKQPYSHSYEKL